MKTTLIEESKGNQTAYNSFMVKPKDIGVICSDLSLKIINELVRTPCCAMDVARKLEQHEQKIYYHLRRLENVGIIKLVASEKRYGMTAKIYDVVSPIIATKLYNDGYSINNNSGPTQDPEIVKFLHPFINDGKLNAKIILSSPHPHGEYGTTGRDAVHMTDFALFLGKFLNNVDPNNYQLDVKTTDEDIKNNNLILIGGPKINVITNKLNSKLPIYFDKKRNWNLVSKLSGNIYNYDNDAVILKIKNPLNQNKEILLLAGIRSSGLKSAVLTFINHCNEIMKGNSNDKNLIAKVFIGFDKKGDGIIDSVKILE